MVVVLEWRQHGVPWREDITKPWLMTIDADQHSYYWRPRTTEEIPLEEQECATMTPTEFYDIEDRRHLPRSRAYRAFYRNERDWTPREFHPYF